MKVRLPRIVQDPLVTKREGLGIERFEADGDDEVFLDGPVSGRVAVVDFDARHGELVDGARFVPPAAGRTLGRYDVDSLDVASRSFNQVSVFATVHATLAMFEEDDALGRRITWAFDAPQLLVVPRAGERARAFYHRESHSLQFFYFPSIRREHRGRTVFSSLSQDIVAHETAHAILDGIAPDLYHAATPQSLGLHEAVADLTALLMALRSRVLSRAVLEATGGSIRDSRLFSSLAEEYAEGKDRLGRVGFLRSLDNRRTLDPDDDSLDPQGKPNRAARDDVHQLGEVLTGALYPILVRLYEERQRHEAETTGRSPFSVSGRALWIATNRFKRMLLRGLDYLPPGEVSLADYGRAVLASDEASHPSDDDGVRAAMRRRFVERRIVEDSGELDVALGGAAGIETTRFEATLGELDLDTLVRSDWAAYELVDRHRELLGIPPGAVPRVRPRLDVTKTYYHREGPRRVRECILKVSWEAREERRSADERLADLPAQRQITAGTTVAIDWESRRVRALLRSDPSGGQRRDRDALLARLSDAGELSGDGDGPRVESSLELMRLRGSAALLHGGGRLTTEKRLVPPRGVDAASFFNLVRWRRQRR